MKTLTLSTIICLLSALAFGQTVGQWELRKRGATGFTSYGVTAENGKAIGFTAGVPAMLTLGGGGGSVATDTIWDAAGDIAVGTGADTSARLGIGTALQVLRVNAGATALEWSTPTTGTVTSVSGSGGTTGLTLTGGAITGIGTLTLGGTLAVANGGTGVTSLTGFITNTMLAGSIDLTTKVTGALPVANGGTNLVSYTTGDLIYASGATTLAKLADVALGSVLSSGGVGVTPQWVKTEINVKAYGATGNARKVTDAVTVNTDATVTSATAAFTAADVGKVVYVEETSASSPYGYEAVPIGTVSSINSGTSIEVSVAAIRSVTGAHLVIGTDDTTAIQSAVTAAKLVGTGARIVFPAGGYIVSSQMAALTSSTAHGLSFEGAGRNATTLFLSPAWNFTGMTGTGIILNAGGIGTRFSGFTIDGNSYPLAASGKNVITGPGQEGTLEDVVIKWCNGFTYLAQSLASGVTINKCSFANAYFQGLYLGGAKTTVMDTYAGNCAYECVVISGISGDPANTGVNLRWIGGQIDESGAEPSLEVTGSTDIVFVGANILGGNGTAAAGAYAAEIIGNSRVRFDACEIIPYTNSTNGGGLTVEAGSTVYVSQSRLSGAGTKFAINNSGTIYDGGNLSIQGTGLTGSALTDGAQSIRAVSKGGTGLASGTSGGILGYTASGTLASSGALTANAIVIGGGAGVLPSTTTTGAGVLTALGINVGSAGAFVTFNGAGGTPSTIVLTNATGSPTGISLTKAQLDTIISDDNAAYLGQANTFTAAQIVTVPAAVSTSGIKVDGTWSTAGTTTTDKPSVLIEPAATTSTGWDTNGTGLGVNAATGFTGQLLDLQLAGATKLKVGSGGSVMLPNTNQPMIGTLDGTNIYYHSGGILFQIGGVNGMKFVPANGMNFGTNFFGGSSSVFDGTMDTGFIRDGAAGAMALRNSTNAMIYRVYNTYTSSTNHERGKMEWASNELRVGTEKGSGGGTARAMALQTNATTALTIGTDQSVTQGANAAGGLTTSSRLVKAVASIADNTATTVATVTIPNAAHSANFLVTLTGSLGAGGAIGSNEATGATKYLFAITRTAGVDTVVGTSGAFGVANASVAGAATITVTAAATGMTGAAGATQTFNVQVTIARGSGASTNHTCLVEAELTNANATGITFTIP